MSSPTPQQHAAVKKAALKKFRSAVRGLKGVLDPKADLQRRRDEEDLATQIGKGMVMTRQRVAPSAFGDPAPGVYFQKGRASTTVIEVAGVDWTGIMPGPAFRGQPSWDVASAPLALIGTAPMITEWLDDNAAAYLINSAFKVRGNTDQERAFANNWEDIPPSTIVVSISRFTAMSKAKRFTVINPITSAITLLAARAAGIAAAPAMADNIGTAVNDFGGAALDMASTVTPGEGTGVHYDETLWIVQFQANAGAGETFTCTPGPVSLYDARQNADGSLHYLPVSRVAASVKSGIAES